jgi:hypothetical protein
MFGGFWRGRFKDGTGAQNPPRFFFPRGELSGKIAAIAEA